MATAAKKSAGLKYDSDNIKNLSFPENIRQKPTLYIGPIDESGVFTIVREVADNVVDEALAGRATRCDIFIHPEANNTVKGFFVLDNGEGIPVKPMDIENPIDGSKVKVPAIQAILTMTHTSGKFDDKAYAAARGCFVGSTKIELVDGRTLTFTQLYREHKQGIINYVWSASRKTGELRAQPIETVHLTKRTRHLVEITLDTGYKFTCTPDHPLYKTSVQKVEAQDSLGCSLLASEFSSDKDGYRLGDVQGVHGKKRLQRVVADYYGQDTEGRHVHHVDENILNNEPDDLKSLTPKEHYEEHPNKLKIWREYLEVSSHEKSELLKDRNQKAWYQKRALRGRVLRVSCRVASLGSSLSRKSYDANRGHAAPKWSRVSELFDSTRELEEVSQLLVEKARLQSARGLSKGLSFLKFLDYKPGQSDKSVTKNHSPGMAAKRAIGKAVKALVTVPATSCSVLELTACIDSKTVSPRSLSQYIDLDEFVSAVRGGVDPCDFMYTDLSDREQAVRRRKFDAELAEEKSLTWGNAPTNLVYNDFMRKLNAMLADGVSLDGSTYHGRYKNAFGNSNWFLGLAACKKLGLEDKDQIVELASRFNHKVVKVTNICLDEPVPVFDLTVPIDHNYRLDCGVFVGNTHGLGVKASNALSRVYHVWTFRDAKWWEISFAYGRPKQSLRACHAPKHPVSGAPLKKGTLVYLEPDPGTFECVGARGLAKVFSLKSPTTTMLLEWCRIASYFTPGLTLRVGHNTGVVKEFVSQDGPKDFIRRKLEQLNKERVAADGESAEPIGLIEDGAEFVSQDALYDCVVAFTNSENANLDAFTNGLRNAEGGLHLTAFLNALQGAITPFAAKGSNFTQRELREGLVALVNVKLSAPQFDSQTKEKLVDQRAGKPVFESLFAAFQEFFSERPNLAKRICERATSLHSLRTKFLASKKVVSKLRDVAKKGLPVKGQVSPDCTAEQRELFIVEGDSAAGSVRNARDPFFQEALPIRGKVINAAKDPKNLAIESDEIINILAQIGFDPKAEDPLEKLRVSKIICLADPDPDGPLTGDSTVPIRFQGEWIVETMENLASDRWAGVEYDVLAWTGKSFCITEAEDCRVTEVVNKLVVITLATGEKIRCAENHELAIITNKPVLRDVLPSNTGLYMVPAHKLKAGDLLACVESGGVKHQWHNLSGRQHLGAIRVEKVKVQSAEGTPVYCLTVPAYHNFVLSSGVVSKNCHINSLLLTLFYKFLPGLFAKGMVYVAEVPEFYAIPKKHPPLFDTKPAALQVQLDKAGLKAEICHIKGYGEIDADILRTLAFDPATRNIIKIVPTESLNGEVEFMKLMGGGSESRKLLLGI